VRVAHDEARKLLRDSPSLRQHALSDCYALARANAADGLAAHGMDINHFPESCPYSLDQNLDPTRTGAR